MLFNAGECCEGHPPTDPPDGGGPPLPGVSAQYLTVPGLGRCLLPAEFAVFTGPVEGIEYRHTRESPRALLEVLRAGTAVVLRGPYSYADALLRYLRRQEGLLVSEEVFADTPSPVRRRAALVAERRRLVHRLLLPARGEQLIGIQDPPDTVGLQDWLVEPTGRERFLIPLRRLQRILTDIRRAREGLEVPGLDRPITLLPHVYVPADQSVPAMFLHYRHLFPGRRVLDMGTGTGVLALLAVRMGADSVVAVDLSPQAVRNARLNVRSFGLEGRIVVPEPGDLFEPIPGERFDVILFNAPWIPDQPRTPYELATHDPGGRVLERFLRGVGDHLLPGGVVLLQYSNISRYLGEGGGMDRLHRVVREAGLRIVSRRRIERTGRHLGGRERVYLFEIRSLEGGSGG